MISECINGDGHPVENQDTGLCASCGKLERKAASLKLPDDPKPIQKVSESQSKLLAKYNQLRKRFLFGRWCAYHGRPCIPTTVHHSAGRIGFIDEEAREKNIPALLDIRYFVPLCMEAHKYIEEHPTFAKENGYSENRLSVKQ
jgi:hypothetical protein